MTALLSGVLARAKAVASSLCVIGRGPVAPLWLRDTGRIPAEAPTLLGGPAGLPYSKHLHTETHLGRLASSVFPDTAFDVASRVTHGLEIFLIIRHALKHEASCQTKVTICTFVTNAQQKLFLKKCIKQNDKARSKQELKLAVCERLS